LAERGTPEQFFYQSGGRAYPLVPVVKGETQVNPPIVAYSKPFPDYTPIHNYTPAPFVQQSAPTQQSVPVREIWPTPSGSVDPNLVMFGLGVIAFLGLLAFLYVSRK